MIGYTLLRYYDGRHFMACPLNPRQPPPTLSSLVTVTLLPPPNIALPSPLAATDDALRFALQLL